MGQGWSRFSLNISEFKGKNAQEIIRKPPFSNETIMFPTFNQGFQHHHSPLNTSSKKPGRLIAKGLLPVGHGGLQPLDAALALPLYPYGTLAQHWESTWRTDVEKTANC